MEKRYQYSKFLGDNRDEQIVIRCDNFDEFTEAKKNIESLFLKKEEIKSQPVIHAEAERPIAPNKESIPIPIEEFEKTCYKCGAKMVINPKTGKIFCERKCWLNK